MLAKSFNLCAFFKDHPKFCLHFVAVNAQSQPFSPKIKISKRIHVDHFRSVSCQRSSKCIPKAFRKSSQISPNPSKIDSKWSPNRSKRPLGDHLGPLGDHLGRVPWKDAILKTPKWPSRLQNGAQIHEIWEKNVPKTITKNIAFPDIVFHRFFMILELFLDRFLEPLDPWKWAYGLDETLIFPF